VWLVVDASTRRVDVAGSVTPIPDRERDCAIEVGGN